MRNSVSCANDILAFSCKRQRRVLHDGDRIGAIEESGYPTWIAVNWRRDERFPQQGTPKRRVCSIFRCMRSEHSPQYQRKGKNNANLITSGIKNTVKYPGGEVQFPFATFEFQASDPSRVKLDTSEAKRSPVSGMHAGARQLSSLRFECCMRLR